MRRRRLIWYLYPAYVGVLLLTLMVITVLVTQSVKNSFTARLAADLTGMARVAGPPIIEELGTGASDSVDAMAKRIGAATTRRITIILPTGEVSGDSDEIPATMDNLANLPEMQSALAGTTGRAVRFSQTRQQQMMYIAIPLRGEDGSVLGAIRVAAPLEGITAAQQAALRLIAIVGLFAIALLTGMTLYVAHRISAPLKALTLGTQQLAQGDVPKEVRLPEALELRELATAMNRMVDELTSRLSEARREQNEQEAVLASMVEGVLAVDRDERIITMNRAAAELIGAEPERSQGRRLTEVVRNSALQDFISTTLGSKQEVTEGEISLHRRGEQIIQTHGSVLRSAQGEAFGAVVVMNDITRLRRLEEIRKDFVSNVSHELKTPITSIKGFVETLLDGEPHSPEDIERFLQIIARHADRLNNIIEDLLTLSRIEQDEDDAERLLSVVPIRGALAEAVQICGPAAQAKNITVSLTCPSEIKAAINAPLLQQGIANLIDNAIKYSDEGKHVTVEASELGNEVVVTVRDEGIGIEPEHLDRLFERFYRVDKARSRSLGGTGLGLAIVRHIVQAHRGYVNVRSKPGIGSEFAIHLAKPRAVPEADAAVARPR